MFNNLILITKQFILQKKTTKDFLALQHRNQKQKKKATPVQDEIGEEMLVIDNKISGMKILNLVQSDFNILKKNLEIIKQYAQDKKN